MPTQEIKFVTSTELLSGKIMHPQALRCIDDFRRSVVVPSRLNRNHSFSAWVSDLLSMQEFWVWCIGEQTGHPPHLQVCYRCYYDMVAEGEMSEVLIGEIAPGSSLISTEQAKSLWLYIAPWVDKTYGTFLLTHGYLPQSKQLPFSKKL